MKHRESELQQACIKWFAYQYPIQIMFAIPNGGKRGIVTAQTMKSEGVLAGVSDLFLMDAKKGYYGMFIEIKSPVGKASQKQMMFMAAAIIRGYHCVVVRSFDEFKSEVEKYLK